MRRPLIGGCISRKAKFTELVADLLKLRFEAVDRLLLLKDDGAQLGDLVFLIGVLGFKDAEAFFHGVRGGRPGGGRQFVAVRAADLTARRAGTRVARRPACERCCCA